MFVIERGDDATQALPANEAVRALLENGDDAFGFPPYAALESFLKRLHGNDALAAAERSIISGALTGVPTTLVRRPQRDWWPTILDAATADAQAAQPVPVVRRS
jgi:hypothetical protein